MTGSSSNYVSQGRILRVGERNFVHTVEKKTTVSDGDSISPNNEAPVRPVVLGIILAFGLAIVCGYQSTYFFEEKDESSSPPSPLLSSDLLQRAVMEYQRPDLAGRIAASAAIPVPPTMRRPLIHPHPLDPSIESGTKKVHKRPSHKQLVDKVFGIIKTHAPKHQNGRILADAIVTEAASQQYDPLFVAAVIKSESTFNAMAQSHKGAQGLMQIMPKTGAWLAKKEEIPRGRLTDPGYNLKLGITYLKHLEEMFHGNRVFVLIAYNWGPGHVESASAGKRKVPSEVVTYAVKIMNDFRRWSHYA